jgi:hypothetical protein
VTVSRRRGREERKSSCAAISTDEEQLESKSIRLMEKTVAQLRSGSIRRTALGLA